MTLTRQTNEISAQPWQQHKTRPGEGSKLRSKFQSWEWPTLFVLVTCYGCWLALTYLHQHLAWYIFTPLTISLVTLHSSLQHEALHGHPTRNCRINEALVFPAIGLFVPYRRFRDTHLYHHNDERLTDPYDDPETWYLAQRQWHELSAPLRALLTINATLMGRLILGPALGIYRLWKSDAQGMLAGDRAIYKAYGLHLSGIAPVCAWLVFVCDINLANYAFAIAYPGMSLLMLRTFAEHRAHQNPGHRTCVIPSAGFLSLIFLNNNLHVVHHAMPRTPWYQLPHLYRNCKAEFDALNGGYSFANYREVFQRHLFRPINKVVHPFVK